MKKRMQKLISAAFIAAMLVIVSFTATPLAHAAPGLGGTSYVRISNSWACKVTPFYTPWCWKAVR